MERGGGGRMERVRRKVCTEKVIERGGHTILRKEQRRPHDRGKTRSTFSNYRRQFSSCSEPAHLLLSGQVSGALCWWPNQ